MVGLFDQNNKNEDIVMDQNKTLLQRLLKGFSKQEGLDDLLRMTEHCVNNSDTLVSRRSST